jgi:hypothetical protein
LLQQLKRATHPAHHDVLLNGLKAVEKEIEEVSVEFISGLCGEVGFARPTLHLLP